MRTTYGIDILDPSVDSLEGVMGLLYPDLFNPLLEERALAAFRALLKLFTARLATTTNDIRATNKRLLYRMLTKDFGKGIDPGDLTIITFNQDLQVEKTLELLSQAGRWQRFASRIFSFPGCYSVASGTWQMVTGPTASTSEKDLFPQTDPAPDCIRVLKLHGSLNWYSTHNSPRLRPSAMFNSRRALSVTRRKTIAPDMTLSRPSRTVYTLPVVVPPVNHKSAVLHEALNPVWRLAEERLRTADEIVIFGYSCPALDFESSNLLRRAQRRRRPDSKLSIVDPDGAVSTRFIDLLKPSALSYFATARDFIRFA